MKCVYLYFTMIFVISATVPKDICHSCMPTHKCQVFGNMDKKNQQIWMEKFSCQIPHRKDNGVPPGFSSVGVCCSNNIWGIESSDRSSLARGYELSSKIMQTNAPDNLYFNNNKNNNQDNLKYDRNDPISVDQNYDGNFDDNNYDIEKTRQRQYNVWSTDRTQLFIDGNSFADKNTRYNLTENSNRNKLLNSRTRYWNDRPGRDWNYRNDNRKKNSNVREKQHGNENDYKNTRRPPFENKRPQRPGDENYNNQELGRHQNHFGNNSPNPYYPSNSDNKPGDTIGQCEQLTSSPPDPRSGCCGRELADDDRITDAPQTSAPANKQHKSRQPPKYSVQLWMLRDEEQKQEKAPDKNVTVDVEKRISGGKATELYQYPWTVLLLTTFNYGNKLAGFNCGGSLISAKYVLSAGHCVYDKNAVVKSVEVNLAEYDKRSFPRDCKVSRNGWKCIENKLLYAEDITIHPQYENEKLLNDISLIRLQGKAPYTEYIRPICLPSINIDKPEFSNLQFEVAGWGRNGPYRSDVKQSTVLHLVNQKECKRFYPMLTTKHLCAAGNKGEDTCKGDSGGPLMTVYRGRFYVTGVVSGKRADSPCGTAVPSLYTNVYHYLDWIRSNVRN